jgi:hypothetical protein
MPDKHPSYDLARVEEVVLRINPEVPLDMVVAALMLAKAAKVRAAEIERMVKDSIVEWIDQNGEFTVGALRYYTGFETDTTYQSNAEVLDAVLIATRGDVRAAADYLGSGAFKHGACKGLLPEDVFGRLFKSVKRKKLKTGEPRKKQLLEARVEVAK